MTLKSTRRAKRLPELCKSLRRTAAGPQPQPVGSRICWLPARQPAQARPRLGSALQNQKSSIPPGLSFLILTLLISFQIAGYNNLHQLGDDPSGKLKEQLSHMSENVHMAVRLSGMTWFRLQFCLGCFSTDIVSFIKTNPPGVPMWLSRDESD